MKKILKRLAIACVCLTVVLLTAAAINNGDEVLGKSRSLDWNLTLVNSENKIDDDYELSLKELRNGFFVDARIYPDLQAMFDDARKAGVYPMVVSAYRTREKQQEIFQNKIDAYIEEGYSHSQAKKETENWVARPGYSEHETGLAVDINEESGDANELFKWLANNSYKYGFVVRYPSNKSKITGISYERWHFRYVGAEAAKYMYDNDLVLEEYVSKK